MLLPKMHWAREGEKPSGDRSSETVVEIARFTWGVHGTYMIIDGSDRLERGFVLHYFSSSRGFKEKIALPKFFGGLNLTKK